MRRRLYNDPMRTNPMRFVGAVERAQAEARLLYPDYDEMAAIGVAAARKNPELRERLLATSNMALAAYAMGRHVSGLPVPLSPAEIQAQQQAEAQTKAEAQERKAAEREARAQAERERRAAERAEAQERDRQEQADANAAALQEVLGSNASAPRFNGLDFIVEAAPAVDAPVPSET